VEIISPNELYERVHAKVLEYLAAGVKQVWLVSPEHRTMTIYRSATHITALSIGKTNGLFHRSPLPPCRLPAPIPRSRTAAGSSRPALPGTDRPEAQPGRIQAMSAA
jgi:hypothetical protein